MSCKWPINSGQITELIPNKPLWIPAGNMVGGVGAKSPIFQSLQIAARQHTDYVAEFLTSEDQEAYFKVLFRDSYFNYADPEIRVCPVWMQIDGAAPSPAEYVLWEVDTLNTKQGESLDVSMEPTPGAQQKQSLVLGQWVHANAGLSADEAIAIPVGNIFGSALAAGDWNLLTFEIERFGNAAGDTFTGSAYLLGVGVQYVTDFSNNGQWPVAP